MSAEETQREELHKLVEDLRDLHLQSERVIRRIDEITRKKDTKAKAPPSTANGGGQRNGDYKYGDKVFITNAVRHVPITRRVTSAEIWTFLQYVIKAKD